ncbi:MAG: hypothetical protein COT73_03315 [Bdellovibrio sp. CG10_big_fil_rev_8_21_14_0_10_47_8]|nr:MAG: hypothetical protein COT73_03315 [Bdellovibrio sp. CG10_big_fil_rev_8_21_14_0_10_47_8]
MKRTRLFWIFGLALLVSIFFWSQKKPGHPAVQKQLGPIKKATNLQADTTTPSSPQTVAHQDRKPSQTTNNSPSNFGFGKNLRALKSPNLKKKSTFPAPSPDLLSPSQTLTTTSWQLLTGTKAVHDIDRQIPAQDVLARVGNYALINDSGFIPDETHFSSRAPLVVYDSRLQKAGVLTGTLRLKIENTSQVQALCQQYNLNLVHSVPEARVYFVKSNLESVDLPAMKVALEKDPRIHNATPEVLSKSYEKK